MVSPSTSLIRRSPTSRGSGWLAKSAEIRLGRNEDRTRTIVESIMGKPEHWQIVVFAASVENAQTLATLLTLQGRSAASMIRTHPKDRRVAIERFKSGELKVLGTRGSVAGIRCSQDRRRVHHAPNQQ